MWTLDVGGQRSAPSSASASVSYAPPTLRGVSVGRGVRRATEGRFELTLRGANLGGRDTASVTLTNHSGAAKACSITWVAPSHAALRCVAPAFFGDVEVVVSAGGQRSAPVRFAYDPPALWSTAASIDCIDAVERASGRRLVLQVRAGEAVASPLASHGAPSARVFSARLLPPLAARSPRRAQGANFASRDIADGELRPVWNGVTLAPSLVETHAHTLVRLRAPTGVGDNHTLALQIGSRGG